jgi:hypothetical protein
MLLSTFTLADQFVTGFFLFAEIAANNPLG